MRTKSPPACEPVMLRPPMPGTAVVNAFDTLAKDGPSRPQSRCPTFSRSVSVVTPSVLAAALRAPAVTPTAITSAVPAALFQWLRQSVTSALLRHRDGRLNEEAG